MSNDLELMTMFVPHMKTQFARGSIVLFTGAGFSLDAVNVSGSQIPSAQTLVGLLWQICYPGVPFDSSTQLQDIYDAALQTNRTATEALMRKVFTVNGQQCPDYYRRLITMPWARIYTLNVDDLVEKVSEQSQGRPMRSISAASGQVADVHDQSLSVIHLNGSLTDVPDRVTFSRSQYSFRGRSEPFYELLRHDLLSRPVVFIGSNLEEGPMWQHLAMRGPSPRRGEAELRPRSYLVTPSLNRSKQALLSTYKIVWLQMTGEQFTSAILDTMSDERIAGNAFLAARYSERTDSGPRIVKIAEIPAGSAEPTEYLLGAEPEWADAKHSRIAHRECIDDIIEHINQIRGNTSKKQFLVVSGTAGTGKSSALMMAALRLEADGVPTGWIESNERFDSTGFRRALKIDSGLGAIFISNADLAESRLSRYVRDAIESNPRMILVCECRSSKVDRIIDMAELGQIEPIEYTIPYLGNSDIDAILQVLDRENRLGLLKGMSIEQRRRVFENEAGRQMLVAMYKATHGIDFKEKAVNELRELDATKKLLYGLVSVAHAHRYFLSKDEIAIACGDDIELWPRALDSLVRRKVILPSGSDAYKSRHREIAQFVYDELIEQGSIAEVLSALIKIAGTKVNINANRNTRSVKMLSTFISHTLLKRAVGAAVGKRIYSEFEQLLSWNYHYWLHRGALELEAGNLGVAENFLLQSKSIEPNDIFVDNELAYLNFRKANESPLSTTSEDLVRDAIRTLTDVAARRPDQRVRVFHIMGSQGLIWSRRARMSPTERQDFLGTLSVDVRNATTASMDSDSKEMMEELSRELQREILSLAVR
jgi:hypothetical protein